jgi:Zn-dependent protease
MKTLFFLLNGAKLGPALWSSGSIILSIATYATIFGWPFAAGFVGLIFVHEMGHYLAALRKGLPVGLPMFIPFLGAYIQLKDQPKDAETEAYVAFAGPFVGTLGAFACFFLWRNGEGAIWLALAKSGMILNLFNLIPLSPLDGGRITAVLGPRIWFLGVPILLGVWTYMPSPMLVLIAVFALPQLWAAWRYDPAAPENVAYYGVPLAVKIEYTVLYIGLAVILALMTNELHGIAR